jgi:hypothetical protein
MSPTGALVEGLRVKNMLPVLPHVTVTADTPVFLHKIVEMASSPERGEIPSRSKDNEEIVESLKVTTALVVVTSILSSPAIAGQECVSEMNSSSYASKADMVRANAEKDKQINIIRRYETIGRFPWKVVR